MSSRYKKFHFDRQYGACDLNLNFILKLYIHQITTNEYIKVCSYPLKLNHFFFGYHHLAASLMIALQLANI